VAPWHLGGCDTKTTRPGGFGRRAGLFEVSKVTDLGSYQWQPVLQPVSQVEAATQQSSLFLPMLQILLNKPLTREPTFGVAQGSQAGAQTSWQAGAAQAVLQAEAAGAQATCRSTHFWTILHTFTVSQWGTQVVTQRVAW